MMRLEKPKARCKECGEMIYDNIEPGTEVICSRDVRISAAKIEGLEKRFGKRIMRERVDTEMEKKYKPLGIIRNKEDLELALQFEKEAMDKMSGKALEKAREHMDRIMTGKVLEKVRKRRGISQKTLAIYLGTSADNLCKQEKGHIPLTTKALSFIDDGFEWQNEEN